MTKAKVLIVEDERLAAEDIRSSLEHLGFAVSATVASGEEAINKAKESNTDLVLMDIVLKGKMDGIEAADQIRSQFNLPVVYLSAHADDKVLERAKVTEPLGYLIKPFEDKELNTVIEMALYKHKAEEALRESEERYRRITESVTDYIYTVRVRDGRAVETTHGPACIAVTGHTAEEFKVNPYLWIQMVHEEDRKAVQEQASRALTGIGAGPLEHRIIRKNGTMRWVRNTPVPDFDSQGRLLSYDGLIQDITERKEAEEALGKANDELYALSQELERRVQERTEELQEKSTQLVAAEKLAAMGKMANRIAHDLRNSLTVVGGFARRMNEKTPDDNPNKKYLGIIVGEVRALEGKVSRIIKIENEE